MKEQTKQVVLGLAFGLISHSALAEDDFESPYLALDYSLFAYESAKQGTSDANPTGLRLRAGSIITPNLGVEAHLGAGATSDDVTYSTLAGTTQVTIDVDTLYGIYLKPRLPLGSLSLYALGGYTYAKFSWSNSSSSQVGEEDLDGGTIGGGAQLDLGKNLSISADLIHYLDGLEAISAGFVYQLD